MHISTRPQRKWPSLESPDDYHLYKPNHGSVPDSKQKHYHFNLKLKQELVPQWDGSPDVLARWISKINHLTNNSLEIRDELGKIIM